MTAGPQVSWIAALVVSPLGLLNLITGVSMMDRGPEKMILWPGVPDGVHAAWGIAVTFVGGCALTGVGKMLRNRLWGFRLTEKTAYLMAAMYLLKYGLGPRYGWLPLLSLGLLVAALDCRWRVGAWEKQVRATS